MPNLISHIDKIGREKQRDVLTLEFHDDKTGFYQPYQFSKSRQMLLAWLKENNIPHYQCGPYASETTMASYKGQIYIDVPYDKKDLVYSKLAAYIENPDGSCKFDGTFFRCYSLAHCFRNAHHDVPSFWQEKSKNF